MIALLVKCLPHLHEGALHTCYVSVMYMYTLALTLTPIHSYHCTSHTHPHPHHITSHPSGIGCTGIGVGWYGDLGMVYHGPSLSFSSLALVCAPPSISLCCPVYIILPSSFCWQSMRMSLLGSVYLVLLMLAYASLYLSSLISIRCLWGHHGLCMGGREGRIR